jgi:RNA polymerase sigma-70 factor, ECF subfamily
MVENPLSDLIGQAALGSKPAFGKIYDLSAAKLFGVLLRILKNRAEAEDALQEVFIKVWQNAARYQQSQASPLSWMIAIARNHAIDRLRARQAPAVDLDEAFDLADDAPNPEQAAARGDDKSQLDHCLGQLPQERAAAIRAAYVDGYSYAELAARFGQPLNTLRTWLRRGLIALRECLEQ